MSARKPLPADCTGDDRCPSEGHIIWRGGGHARRRWGHIDLTPGQRLTLTERRARAAETEVDRLTIALSATREEDR